MSRVPKRRSDFGRAVSRILSAPLRAERIICLSSQYPKPVPVKGRGAGSSPVSYLALHPMGFSVPPRLLLERWAFTPPFHPYRRPKPAAVCFLWHCPSKGFSAFRPRVSPPRGEVTRHRALWSSDFPPPIRKRTGSDSPPFQNQKKGSPKRARNQARRETAAALVHHGEVHVTGVVKNTAAVDAGDDFRLGLAGDEDLRGKFHVATAANAMLNADHHRGALVLEQTFVTRAGGRIHRRQKFRAIGFEPRKFLLQIFLAFAEIGDQAIGDFAGLAQRRIGRLHVLLNGLGLFHEFDLLVVQLYNGLLAKFNLMGQRAIFLVLLGLKLLEGIFLDLRFFGLDIQLELFAVGLNLLGAIFGGVKVRLGAGRPGVEHLALRLDARKLVPELKDAAVAVLENEQFFNGFEHAQN